MYSTINNNKLMGILFLDIAKAFNCINHRLLYKKMYEAGFANGVVNWFRTYLSRSQILKYGDKNSSCMEISNGIAQGTVLGPLIFIFYTNDTVNTLDKISVLYYSGNNWNAIHAVIQREFNMFVDWTVKNSLKLSDSKTQAMILGPRSKLHLLENPTPFNIKGKNINFVKQYTYLGVIIDNELSLVPMYKNMEKCLVDKVYMLRKIRKYLTYKASLQIYKQTILPMIDYPGHSLIACNKNRKSDLQIIQNDVLRFCENKRLQDKVSIELLHQNAKLVSLEQRRM